ncbi:MAG: glycosyltransferase, partial [Gemmatimonadaceae bacterium]
FWYALESWAVRRANLVIAANHERAALMQSHYRLKRMPTVIRNIPPAIARGAALTHLAPPPPGVTRLIYQGDVSLDRGVGRFVEAVAHLGGAFELVIVGGGPDLGAVDELRHRLNAGDRIRLLGRVPASDLPALMASAHLGVVCYPTSGLNNVYCAPNKLYEYAQAGIPMVATPNRVVDAVFAAYGVGVSGEDVVSCIRAAVTSRELLIANIPRFLAENTWTDEASVLVDAYRCLLGDPAGKERAR